MSSREIDWSLEPSAIGFDYNRGGFLYRPVHLTGENQITDTTILNPQVSSIDLLEANKKLESIRKKTATVNALVEKTLKELLRKHSGDVEMLEELRGIIGS